MTLKLEDFSKFSHEQQDAVLAEMQARARQDWKDAATVADRSSAVTAFSQATRAREKLYGVIAKRQADAVFAQRQAQARLTK